MIRAIRPNAMAQDDAALISGWNISPNVAYVVQLNPGSAACGVLVYSEDQTAIIASGAGLVGRDQPVILHPYAGQTIGMVDADIGWHLLLTTDGTESQRTIRIGPAVDLPDEIHPIYADDALAVVRATAGVDDHAHYIDDISVTCPLGLGAGLGDVASVPVGGAAVAGQVESITWTGTPDGMSEQAVIRRHVAIAPEQFVEHVPVVPPVVADDAGATDAATATSGNVLTNDEPGLTVVAVNGLSTSVGVAVDGSNGGTFTIASNGAWTFDPDGDFAALTGAETAETSVTYHASDGVSEASATLTVTVSSGVVPELWTPAEIASTFWIKEDGTLGSWTDHSGGLRHFTEGNSANQPSLVNTLNGLPVRTFAGNQHMSYAENIAFTAQSSFVVMQHEGAEQYQRIFTQSDAGNDYGNSGHYIPLIRGVGNADVGSYAAGGMRSLVVCGQNAFNLVGSVHSGSSVQNFINGVGGTAYAHTLNKTFTRFRVGQLYGIGSGSLTGRVAEVVVIPAGVSEDIRQKIEGYLMHRWGLASLLPSGHPYKTFAPTV